LAIGLVVAVGAVAGSRCLRWWSRPQREPWPRPRHQLPECL